MVIRYRGTSPKLGSCQGECPYPSDYFFGGGEVGIVDDVGLSSVFQGIGSPSQKDDRVSGILKSAAKLILLNLYSYSQFSFAGHRSGLGGARFSLEA